MFSLKSILKTSSVYTLLGFLPTASRIFLLPIFLIYLPPSEFSLIALNTLVASVLPLFMTLGLENAFVRFFYDYKKSQKLLKSYISTLVIFIVLNSIVIGLLFLPFGNFIFHLVFKSEQFSFFPYGITAIISAIFSSIASLFINYYRNTNNLKSYVSYSLSVFLISTIFEIFAIVVLKTDAKGVIMAKLIPSGIITTYFLIKLMIKNGIYFEKRFLKDSFKYALPLIPYSGFSLLFLYYDRILIENYLNLESLAVYNVATSIANITDSFLFAIQMATYPIIYEMLKDNPKANLDKVSQTYRLIGLVVVVAMGVLIAGAPIAIINFLKPVYIPAIKILPIILISYAFRYLYIVYGEPLFFFKKTKYLPFISIITGAISVVGNLLCIPVLGIVGASIVSVVSKIVQFLIAYYLYFKINTLRFKISYVFILICFVFFISGVIFFYFDFLINNTLLLYMVSFTPVIFCVSFIYLRFLKHTSFKVFIPTPSLIKEVF